MEIHRRSVLMMSAPALGAFLLGAVLLGGVVPNTTDKFGEGLGAAGYVVVSVVRDGNEIYHYEDHNQITEAGVDFFVDQISYTPLTNVTASYIALSTTTNSTTATDDDNTSCAGEITDANGLARAAGTVGDYTFATANNDDSYSVSKAFSAIGSYTGVVRACLFTDVTNGAPDRLVAENIFSSVNLASGDTLTVTWTIDFGVPLLDT